MLRSVILCLLCAAGLLAQGDARRVVQSGAISSPGNYILTQDIIGELAITASDVTLNMNGFGVTGPAGPPGTGLTIRGARGVKVTGGSFANFRTGVMVENSSNVVLRDLRIRGMGLSPTAGGPDIGVTIVQSSNVVLESSALYNVGLGVFVRGGRSIGNRIAGNTITAGANGVLGICYNPAPADPNGPRGDLIYNNLISRYDVSIALSETSRANVMKGNTLIFLTEAVKFMDPSNVDMDNVKQKMP